MKGEYVEAKPFEKYEDDDVIDYFGKELVK
jgi:hypothetical protein